MERKISQIIKRNGKIVPFDHKKISEAISKAAQEVGRYSPQMAEDITEKVVQTMQQRFASPRLPQVEEIQDIVEEVLLNSNYPQVSKAYIIYRHERSKEREQQDFSQAPQNKINKINKIVKRDSSEVIFDQEKITIAIHKAAGAVGIHDKQLCQELSNQVVWYINQEAKHGDSPAVEDIQDIVEGTLIKEGHAQIAKAYILYRNQRAKQRQNKKYQSGGQGVIPYKKLWEVLNWNMDHKCETVEKLNEHIREGSIKKLITDSEQAYYDDVASAAKAILERKHEVRLVIIAGPSSSGKTTTTMKLAEHLRKEGLKLIALNIDNYFFNLECHPKDEFGDYDFETPEALDLSLINQHLKDLLEYKTVQVPRYDFKSGKRLAETDPFSIKEDEIILIDTLHGLYAPMTDKVADNLKFKLYIETFSQLRTCANEYSRWTDVRLLRRMVRDARQRAYDPRMTIEHWHYVRRSELKHIIPYIPTVDYIVNGALAYELAVMKKYLFHYFPEFVKNYQDIPARRDAYIRAKRVFELLNTIETLEDDKLVPENSLLREFIGGSSYTYHV